MTDDKFLLDIAKFRIWFPQFKNAVDPPKPAFPDVLIEQWWWEAERFVVNSKACFWCLEGLDRKYALYLMAAHIGALWSVQNDDNTKPYIAISATVDKVSVALKAAPDNESAFKHWLELTPYGLKLLALLVEKASGGVYFGGLPERSAFRKVGGIY